MSRRKPPSMRQCGLCKQSRKLCDSHLLPRAVYRNLRFDRDGNRSAKGFYILDGAWADQSFEQIKKDFLCKDCEHLFNTEGETWLLDHYFRKLDEFRLQALLTDCNSREPCSVGWIIRSDDVPGLKWEKLAYFATSIIWRAGVTTWKFRQGPVSVPLASRHEEAMRLYLLAQAHFPSEAVVSVAVAQRREPIAHAMHLPTHESFGSYQHYRFAIPGMIFDFVIGTEIPQMFKDHCIVRGHRHPIYLLKDNRLFREPALFRLTRAKPTPALMRSLLPGATKMFDELLKNVPRR